MQVTGESLPEPVPGLVSVVISTNRSGRFIEDALRSLRTQTYPHWEVIVIDNGSPDRAAFDAALADFPEVRLIRHEDRGVCIARNAGAVLARGQYIAFLDDDDWWEPRRLELQVAAFEADPSVVMVHGRIWSVDMAGQIIGKADQVGSANSRELFSRKVIPACQSITMGTQAFREVGCFNPSFRYAEDMDLLLRLAGFGEVAFVDEPLGYYRFHDANATLAGHEVADSVREVLRLHRFAAQQAGDATRERDLNAALRRNRVYAAYVALTLARQRLKERRLLAAAGEVLWGAAFAPDAPAVVAARRLRSRLAD